MRFSLKINTAIAFPLIVALASALVYITPAALIIEYDIDFSKISIASTVFLFSIALSLFFSTAHALKIFNESKFNTFQMGFFTPLTILALLQILGPRNIFNALGVNYIDVRNFFTPPNFDDDIDFARLAHLAQITSGELLNQIAIFFSIIPILFIYYYLMGYVFRRLLRRGTDGRPKSINNAP